MSVIIRSASLPDSAARGHPRGRDRGSGVLAESEEDGFDYAVERDLDLLPEPPDRVFTRCTEEKQGHPVGGARMQPIDRTACASELMKTIRHDRF